MSQLRAGSRCAPCARRVALALDLHLARASRGATIDKAAGWLLGIGPMTGNGFQRGAVILVLWLLGASATAWAAAPDISAAERRGGGAARSGAGGVSLFKAAELLDALDLTGARAEWAKDRLAIVRSGGARVACPPLDKEYVALAVRCVYGHEEDVPGKLVADEEKLVVVSTGRERYGEVAWNKAMLPRPWQTVPVGTAVQLPAGPGVGILYLPQPSMARVTYYGPIRNTRMGKVLMESDRVLFPLMEGVDDRDGRPAARPDIPGFMTLKERRVRNWPAAPPAGSQPARPSQPKDEKWWHDGTWFVLVPERFTLKLDGEGQKLDFAESRMIVATWTGKGEVDRSAQEFAQHLSEHFADFAAIYPEWRELVEVAKAVTFVRWLRQQGVAMDEAWARDVPIQPVETIDTMRRVSVEFQFDKDGKPIVEKQVQP